MLAISSRAKVFLHSEPVDLRKSFEGLSVIVLSVFVDHLTSGDYFAFFNRRKDRVKVLYWDLDGFVLWYKQLQSGTFLITTKNNTILSRREFFMLLEGITPKKLQKRFQCE
jgi:transposase